MTYHSEFSRWHFFYNKKPTYVIFLHTFLLSLYTKPLKTTNMNKVFKFILKVLDEGETNNARNTKIPSFKITPWLLISTTIVIPLFGCIFAGTFMDVNSREFIFMVLPILINIEILLCWILHHFLCTMNFPLRKRQHKI